MVRKNTYCSGIAWRMTRAIIAFTVAAISSTSTHAREPEPEESMPEGMIGWFYYVGAFPMGKWGYARKPEHACALTAANHFQSRLLGMNRSPGEGPYYDCIYRHSWTGMVFTYAPTQLFCKAGYSARWPGVCIKAPEVSRPPSCSPDQPAYAVSNPVIVSSGAKAQSETDIPDAATGALRINRTYRTLRETGAAQSAGQGWSFSFDRIFSPSSEKSGTLPYKANGVMGDGSYFDFRLNNSGKYISRYDRRESLQSLSEKFDDWLVTTSDGGVDRFQKVNDKFQMVSSHTSDGVVTFYSYGADNKIETISDASGRTLKVTWDGRVVTKIAGNGGVVRYQYELADVGDDVFVPGTERLVGVQFYDEAERLIGAKKYHYEDANFRHLLTGVTDENGVRFANYAYNENGQAVLSEHAGGANRYVFSYPEKNKRIITDPLGTERVLGITYPGLNAAGLVTGASQPAGAGCGPGNSTTTYDTVGRRASSINFNEQKTCYTNDTARGLETSRVSGLAKNASCPASSSSPIPANSRRISTQWHPDWSLKIAEAIPNQMSYYIYNGQRDTDGKVLSCADNATLPDGKPLALLCARKMQATQDASGAQGFAARREGAVKIWRYTYNKAGKMLTRTGPTGASGQAESVSNNYYDDTTASHTQGDLANSHNAVGEVTQFLEYSKEGLVTKVQRPDGMIHIFTYGPRQRLASSTLEDGKGGAERTQYFYDDADQLTRIVSPDGAAISFAYDEAHRLTSRTDNAGSRIQLTLDKMGNVTRQEVRNAAGELVNETNRTFDALNRLTKEQRDLLSPATIYQYDRGGNLTSLSDALGRITTRQFDNLNRMRRQVLPPPSPAKPSTAIGYDYNLQDQLTSVTDPRMLTTRYALDVYGKKPAW
jgi:YD repeat-containing protein